MKRKIFVKQLMALGIDRNLANEACWRTIRLMRAVNEKFAGVHHVNFAWATMMQGAEKWFETGEPCVGYTKRLECMDKYITWKKKQRAKMNGTEGGMTNGCSGISDRAEQNVQSSSSL